MKCERCGKELAIHYNDTETFYRCIHCGWKSTGNQPESQVCPVCGTENNHCHSAWCVDHPEIRIEMEDKGMKYGDKIPNPDPPEESLNTKDFMEKYNKEGKKFIEECKGLESSSEVMPLSDPHEERWLDIPGYVGYYQVSDHGRVRSLYKGDLKIKKARLYKGYENMHLHKDGKSKSWLVHTLVMMAFGPEKPDGYECDHIDRDRANNHIDNLRWVSRSENQNNKKGKVNTTNRFKGVYYHAGNNRYISRITINKQLIHLGSFKTDIDAAMKYDEIAELNGILSNKELGNYG